MLKLVQDTTESPRITYPTELFGPLRASAEHVLVFQDGLLGFPTCTRWMLLEGVRTGTAWLQSLDHMALAFLLVDPFIAFDEFAVELGSADIRRLGTTGDNDVLVWAMVTVPAASDMPITANLRGPIVIDVRTRRGMQLVLPESTWGLREIVPSHLIGRAA